MDLNLDLGKLYHHLQLIHILYLQKLAWILIVIQTIKHQPPATIQSIAQGTHPPREHMQNPPNQLREQVYPPSQPVDNTEQLQANPHQKKRN